MSNPKDEAFNYLWRLIAKNYVDSQNETNKSASFRLGLAIVGVLLFVGYESVRILLRKNFGMTIGNWIRVGLGVLCFTGIAIIAFVSVNSTDSFALNSGSSDAHFVTGMLYTILAVTIVVKSIIDRNKRGNDTYSGDSVVLHFLTKDRWWNAYKIQNLAEPILVLTLGIAFCLFDWIAGIPLLFCALSVWANALFELLYKGQWMQATVNKYNADKKKKTFHEVNTDL